MKPQSPKRRAEILKSYDEMYNRMLVKSWKRHSSVEWELRLQLLLLFSPQRSCRALINNAKLNTKKGA